MAVARVLEQENGDDPVASAEAAGLRYVSDEEPGIRRRRAGRGFTYVHPDGKTVKEDRTLSRIRALAIPPAWTDVWICPSPRGHLQATGRDARGRKQYRYHPDWRQVRDETKFDRAIAFAQALPAIRKAIDEHLSQPGLSREKVLATVVRLLERTLIRVGNEEYARTNQSFGLTTLRDKHVDVSGSTIEFRFKGKSGKDHVAKVTDRRLARVVQRCQDIPGYELFQYIDENGERQKIGSADVNQYLREISGSDFTAKDFRTWAGTILASLALQEMEAFDSEAQAKKNIVRAIERVAGLLGNTPTVCRQCYVHPAVLDAYMDGTMVETLKQRADRVLEKALPDLAPEEGAILALLRRRLEEE